MLVGSVSTDRPQNQVAAGETMKFKATITNKGSGVAGQVRATLKGDDPMFEGREFVFGRIKPGESRTFVVPVKLPKDVLTRTDPLHLEVAEEHGAKTQLDTNELLVRVEGSARPVFSYAYQLVDDLKGNGDGLIQRGESLRLHVTVKNVGPGKSNETLAQLRNLSDEGVFINKGRFNVDNLQPGESKSVDFTFDVGKEYRGDNVKVEMTVYDAVLHEFVSDKLTLPIEAAQPTESATGSLVVNATGTQVRGGASDNSPLVGTAEKGTSLKLTGSAGNFWRVELDGRPGFIMKAAATRVASGSAGRVAALAPAWQVSPPRLDVKNPVQLVDAATFHLAGVAKDEHKLADVFVFVTNRVSKIEHRKVFYQSNRKGQNPSQANFATDIPLWPGANYVTVVARENSQVQSQQTLVVERREPSTVAQTHAKPETPIEPGH
jgi:carboxyl-terminal processing protease